jgi:phospholipid/cholesterol/gamma-HCH transport system ATP-binding protein
MLTIRDLHVTLNHNAILRGVDLELKDGESLVVLGCSGTGKSVLLKTILGLLPKQQGSIFFENTDLGRPGQAQVQALRSIGMLFQGSALFDSLSIVDNIAFGLVHGRNMSAKVAKSQALEMMEAVGLDRKSAHLLPSDLSGGMQKRVGLARALILRPKMFLFDEPTTGLDPITSSLVNELILNSVKKSNIGIITITHDLGCVHKIADKVCFLFEGRIIWEGSVKGMDSTENPYIRQFLDALPHGPLTSTLR